MNYDLSWWNCWLKMVCLIFYILKEFYLFVTFFLSAWFLSCDHPHSHFIYYPSHPASCLLLSFSCHFFLSSFSLGGLRAFNNLHFWAIDITELEFWTSFFGNIKNEISFWYIFTSFCLFWLIILYKEVQRISASLCSCSIDQLFHPLGNLDFSLLHMPPVVHLPMLSIEN